ncbi:MAG: ATP-grasp domain-containing protein [Candidatus Thorarchaeota archaeon]
MASLRVLVTDGSSKHTLAAVRSLGQSGFRVTVIDKSPLAESFYSRYCHERRLISRTTNEPERYVLELKRILSAEEHDVLLPIGWFSNYSVSKYAQHLRGLVRLAIPSFQSMEIAANKDLTMEHAERVGINVPKTIPLRTQEDLALAAEHLGFPLVVKGSLEAGTVRFPEDMDEMEQAYMALENDRPIAQQYIRGNGYGYFAAYNQGTCIAQFMHKRVREFPTSGGPSAAAVSVFSSELADQGRKLLDSLDWHGVAMVEFKRSDRDNRFYLMEVNPKFWGSLELAIHAGVDFPRIACDIAMGRASKMRERGYRTDVFFRWPFPGELLYALETKSYSDFIRRFFSRQYQDDVRLSDPVPTALQLWSTMRKVRKWRKGN